MKRLLFIAIFGCLVSLAIQAQENRYFPATGKALNFWGLRLNYDYQADGYGTFCGHEYKPFGAGPGISLGGVYHYSFGKRFFLEPELNLFYDTRRLTNDYYNDYLKRSGRLSTLGVRLPVKIGMAFHFSRSSIFLFTGVVESYSFYSREKAEFKNPEIPKIDRSAFDMIKHFKTQVCLGATYAQGHFCVTLNLNFSATNILKQKDYWGMSSCIQTGVGYNF